MTPAEAYRDAQRASLAGGSQARLGTKLPVRERLAVLLDPGSFVEDGLLASSRDDAHLPAEGVLTGTGTVDGRQVVVIAHDPTVKAGSWGARTVEKQIRILEHADRYLLPVFYLVDSAGGRLTDALGFHPGHRGGARIFHMQVRLSGRVPQLCCLMGPSAAGGAYMPAFCDWVGMVDGNASMYLASPRVAEQAIGEKVTHEEMGGARMHCTTSGMGDQLFPDDASAITACRELLAYLPASFDRRPETQPAVAPAATDWDGVLPASLRASYDMRSVIDRVVDGASFFEIKARFAKEIIVGFARLDGRVIGIVANQPKVRAGTIGVDSADKAARFISLCDAFNVPLLFLADLPGFMVGSSVERQGIIRHGAKMIAAMSSCAVPRFCVVIRKSFAAGYYAMSSPGFEPTATLALPGAQIGAMAGNAAVHAVWANKIEAIEDREEREAFIREESARLDEELDVLRVASELLIEAVVEPEDLRTQLAGRLAACDGWTRPPAGRHHGAFPV